MLSDACRGIETAGARLLPAAPPIRGIRQRPPRSRSRMKRFLALEGLRAWLAWAVVLSHMAYVAGISPTFPGSVLGRLGSPAVLVFIIVSGFVITHLIIEKPEPYGIYLLRRFMRIFPVFLITCIIGFVAYDIEAATLARVAYLHDPGYTFSSRIADIAQSNHEFFWAHAIAHLTMLNGAVSDKILPFSGYAFNMPAWSLSLEWQFYLIAPFVVVLIHRNKGLLVAGIAVAALEYASRHDLFGTFEQPSFLPAAFEYFFVGIASRYLYPLVADVVRPSVVLIVAAVLLPIFAKETIPILLWVVVVSGMRPRPAVGAASTWFERSFRLLLESRVVNYFGSRSYSTYLCHMPAIAFCHTACFAVAPKAGPAATFIYLFATAIPLTTMAAEIVHRTVERPGIALGARLARRISHRPLPVEADAAASPRSPAGALASGSGN